MTAENWNGPPCEMCNGTGADFTYSGEPMQNTRRDIPTGQPCRACNGHGRQPTPEPPAPTPASTNPTTPRKGPA